LLATDQNTKRSKVKKTRKQVSKPGKKRGLKVGTTPKD